MRRRGRNGYLGVTGQDHAPSRSNHHSHEPQRTFAHIRDLIHSSTLPDWVKHRSIAVFERIARAEGRIHGLPPDQVCSACHSPAHNRAASTTAMAQCADCHEHVRKVASANPHKDYAEKACTSCHDPHASPHEFQLKQPLETYDHELKADSSR